MTKPVPDKSTWVTEEESEKLAAAIDELLDSGEFNAAVRKDHFDAGVPISYMDDKEPLTGIVLSN